MICGYEAVTDLFKLFDILNKASQFRILTVFVYPGDALTLNN